MEESNCEFVYLEVFVILSYVWEINTLVSLTLFLTLIPSRLLCRNDMDTINSVKIEPGGIIHMVLSLRGG